MTTLTHPCPQCQKPTIWADNPTKPFCSERCKLIDLGAWASESYRVPADDTPFSDELTPNNQTRTIPHST